MKTIVTERLMLRSWQESDADDLYEFGKNETVKMAGWEVMTDRTEAMESIRAWQRTGESWAIVQKETKKVIGEITLEDCGRDERYREMEFVISDAYAGQGYASEAALTILRYAFEDLDMSAVAICHYPDNHASRRVIEKCGFTYEGTLRRYSRHLTDSVRYSMLKEEWESLKK